MTETGHDEQMKAAAEAYLRANGVEGITITGGGDDWFVSVGFAEHERFVTAYSKRNPNTPDDPLYLAEQALQTLIRNERPVVLAPEPEQVETPQHESDGETGEEAGGEHSTEPDLIDADFEAIDQLGAQGELAEPDFETLALEGSDPEPEAPAQDGPIAYGASTIDGLIREKLGRVSQIARELKAIQQEGWTVEEYAYLQNLMVRMDRGEAPDDQASRERFLAIAAKSQAMSRIDGVRDRKEGELEEIGQRRDFDAAVYYEPGEGWPQ